MCLYRPSPALVTELSAVSLCARQTVRKAYSRPHSCRRASLLRVAGAASALGLQAPRWRAFVASGNREAGQGKARSNRLSAAPRHWRLV